MKKLIFICILIMSFAYQVSYTQAGKSWRDRFGDWFGGKKDEKIPAKPMPKETPEQAVKRFQIILSPRGQKEYEEFIEYFIKLANKSVIESVKATHPHLINKTQEITKINEDLGNVVSRLKAELLHFGFDAMTDIDLTEKKVKSEAIKKFGNRNLDKLINILNIINGFTQGNKLKIQKLKQEFASLKSSPTISVVLGWMDGLLNDLEALRDFADMLSKAISTISKMRPESEVKIPKTLTESDLRIILGENFNFIATKKLADYISQYEKIEKSIQGDLEKIASHYKKYLNDLKKENDNFLNYLKQFVADMQENKLNSSLKDKDYDNFVLKALKSLPEFKLGMLKLGISKFKIDETIKNIQNIIQSITNEMKIDRDEKSKEIGKRLIGWAQALLNDIKMLKPHTVKIINSIEEEQKIKKALREQKESEKKKKKELERP